MKLEEVLERFDTWLARSPERQALLAPPATSAAITRVEKKLGKKLPACLKTLYAWHEGQANDSTLFDLLCQEDYALSWDAIYECEVQIDFMSLAELESAIAFGFVLTKDNAIQREGDEAGGKPCELVPFVRIHRKDEKEPSDDDWLIAVDTAKESVWLFESGGEGLEDVGQEAKDLATWLDARLSRLEKEEAAPPKSTSAKTPQSSSAEMLLQFLMERKLLQLEDDLPEVAKRLAPLLALKPEKRAVVQVISFLEDDDGIEEVFADDEMLRAIIVEFLD